MNAPFPRKNLLIPIYFASLLYAFHYALPLYVDSSFITSIIPSNQVVGMVFAVSALISILATLLLPRLLKRFGNYLVTKTAIGFEIAMLLMMSFFSMPEIILPVFILHHVLLNILYLNLDSFIEASSTDATTGGIRGIFLTTLNVAIVIAPFLGGLILSQYGFGGIYLFSAFFMIVMYVVIRKNFKDYQDPNYQIPAFRTTLKTVAESHDLHSIIFIHFLLNFFFAWMVIYTPLYLNEHMGIPMSDILTIIIPIALTPFVIFQIFLGKLADKRLGEKEILTVGLIIMAVSTASLSLVTTGSIAVWTAGLFLTRVGASAVEIMAETYFYKQVGPNDMHLITFMRMIRSGAYLIGPLAGALALVYVEQQSLFIILGAIILLGLPYSLTIKDSR